MSDRIYVVPAAGKSPRAPEPPYAVVPAEGDWVKDSAAWRRLARFGDIEISKTGPAKAKASEKSAAAPKAKS